MSGTPPRGGPAPSPLVHVEIRSVPEEGSIWVRFLGPLRQLGTHFRPKGPLACFGPKACDKEHHKLPYRSKWYAPAQEYLVQTQVWRTVVLEITEGLERLLRGRTLRGEVWCLFREVVDGDQRKNILGTHEETLADNVIPARFEVDDTLKRVYKTPKLPSEKIGNLLPDRPLAVDQVAPPPARLLAEQEAQAAQFSSEELLKRQRIAREHKERRSRWSGPQANGQANGQDNGQANGQDNGQDNGQARKGGH